MFICPLLIVVDFPVIGLISSFWKLACVPVGLKCAGVVAVNFRHHRAQYRMRHQVRLRVDLSGHRVRGHIVDDPRQVWRRAPRYRLRQVATGQALHRCGCCLVSNFLTGRIKLTQSLCIAGIYYNRLYFLFIRPPLTICKFFKPMLSGVYIIPV